MDANIIALLSIIILVTTVHCLEIVVVHPESVNVTEGNNVTLKCVFSEPVKKCTWYRKSDDPLDISGRYHYIDTNANGIHTTDCSISIEDFKKIDEGKWQCSKVHGDEGFHEVKSNIAYLTMLESIKTNKTQNSTSPPSSETPKLAGTLILGLDQQNAILLLVGFGLLVATMVFTLIICYCRKSKDKKDIYLDAENALATCTKNNVSSTALSGSRALLDPSKALSQSSESVCAFCHQQKPESCTPGEVWSAPPCKHLRDSRLPLPERPTLEQLPPYLADQLYDDTGRLSSIEKYPCDTSDSSGPSSPPTPVPVDYYVFVEDILEKFPPDKNSTALSTPSSATSVTTFNPVYGDSCATKSKQETRVFFPSSQSPLPGGPMANVHSDRPMSDVSDGGIYARIQLQETGKNDENLADSRMGAGQLLAHTKTADKAEEKKPEVPEKTFKLQANINAGTK